MNLSNKKFIVINLGILLFPVASFSANFNAYPFNTYPGDLNHGDIIGFGAFHSADEMFTDTYTFNLTSDVSVSAKINDNLRNVGLLRLFKIDELEGSLGSTTGLTFSTARLEDHYTMTITGHVTGPLDGSEGRALSAMPLPAAAWMFGSAFTGLTLLARRRNQFAQYA